MFFSTDLLERRDSGYGLLWLAATLGAKSSFKKLPKRSVLTADISQLCGLIAQPPEPLALRLSSNLMVVKQEIFLTDVTSCFNALKKAVQDFATLSAAAAELQMGQPSLRPEALTLVADPGAAFGIAFENVFAVHEDGEEGSDDEFDPKSKKPKSKGKQKQKDASTLVTAEHPRALHTLEENHNYLLAAALEASLSGSVRGGTGIDASSSAVDGQFGFDDSVFAFPENAGGLDIGDELARELGEGWGVPVSASGANLPPSGSVIIDMATFSPRASEANIDQAITMAPGECEPRKPVQRKAKRVRLLLDTRTELTDDELKSARANYVEDQEALKREIAQKKAEKDNSGVIEEMIYGVPKGIEAPLLVDFWLANFKLHVRAHSGRLHLEMEGEPPRKRQRVQDLDAQPFFAGLGRDASSPRIDDYQMDVDWSMGIEDFAHAGDDRNLDSRLRSSEEPGQARHASRPPSALGSHLAFDLGPTQDVISGSQRSAFFPWDHAGPSSSAGGAPFSVYGSDGLSGLRPGRKRVSSASSRRESLLLPPGGNTVPPSPMDLGLRSSQIGEDFQFNIPEETQEESQQSTVLTLEKNSFNFLEYAKMQLRAFPSATAEVSFDDVVPKATSTRRVAAAAFYHCLVLSTKDLVSVSQDEPYAVLKIRVK
ncbi:hypothetical protein DICSQDRAFT_151165 [Dichomitus squalens LYAD-421 SS1]|uniref:uncharacterized protein n=1 Tax=Dichomitus squalens (strain LYAD-421) TaxID=732165 RepID=UPI0004412C96|nr:uncharacterized protein DICSQDRAFT_151165 [Dichomitus squalens LYAD-421 SS1]EJF66721.1 hypothetical protein DICSQDRAFT_151165 [Dichomitus squalens LYAD-421 SS1]